MGLQHMRPIKTKMFELLNNYTNRELAIGQSISLSGMTASLELNFGLRIVVLTGCKLKQLVTH